MKHLLHLLFSCFLFLTSPYTISNSVFEIHDLEYTNENNFAIEASDWLVDPMDRSSPTSYSLCGATYLLGGYLVGSNTATFERTYSGFPSHSSILLTVNFWFIDLWESGDSISLNLFEGRNNYFSGTILAVSQAQTNWQPSICGSSSSSDLPSAYFRILFQHADSALTIQFENSISISDNTRGSSGIRDVRLTLLTTSPASTTFCTTGPASSLDSTYDCNCPENQYKDLETEACQPCDTSCNQCFGPNSNQCVTCGSSSELPNDGICPTTAETEIPLTGALAVSRSSSKVVQAAVVATSLLAVGNPSGMLMGWFAKMFAYIKYLDVNYSDKLQRVLETWSEDFVSIDFGSNNSVGPELDTSGYHDVPEVFAKWDVNASFLATFWDDFYSIGAVILALICSHYLTKYFQRAEKKKLQNLSLKLKFITFNYLLSYIYENYGSILFSSLLDYKSTRSANATTVFSIIISVIFIACGIFSFHHHLKFIKGYYQIKKQDTEQLEEYTEKHKLIEILFEDFHDKSSLQLSFALICLLRDSLFNIILIALYQYPLAQAILIFLMGIFSWLYLVFQRPLKNILDLSQQIFAETILFIVNLNVLILASLQNKGTLTEQQRDRYGNVIITVNIIFNFSVFVFLGIQVLLTVIPFIQKLLKKLNKKSQKIPSVSGEISPLNAGHSVSQDLFVGNVRKSRIQPFDDENNDAPPHNETAQKINVSANFETKEPRLAHFQSSHFSVKMLNQEEKEDKEAASKNQSIESSPKVTFRRMPTKSSGSLADNNLTKINLENIAQKGESALLLDMNSVNGSSEYGNRGSLISSELESPLKFLGGQRGSLEGIVENEADDGEKLKEKKIEDDWRGNVQVRKRDSKKREKVLKILRQGTPPN